MTQYPLKAVILTALPDEFKSVRKFVQHPHQVRHPLGNVYEQGTFAANGQEWQVGIVQTGAGDSKSALQTERAISHFEPDVVLFVGVAGGLKDVEIGDVVASTKVYGYESGKAEQEFKPRPEFGLSGFSFIEEAKAEERSANPAWLNRSGSLSQPAPQLKVGPIAVGEKVVASKESDVYKFLRQNYSDAIAVEMEGYGFLEAVNSRGRPLPAIVIRGISDLIDNKNDDIHQEPESIRQQKAARHASALAFQLLATYNPDQSITGTILLPTQVESQFWDELFASLQVADIDFLKMALEDALIASKRDYPLGQINTLSALQEVLRKFDDKALAIDWVKRICERVEQALEGDTLFTVPLSLHAWYESNQLSEALPEESAAPSYLLVTLDPVDDEDNVRLTAELHVDGEMRRTDFVPPGTTCSIEDVCDHLSKVIPQAGEVSAVEIFLSWQHLNQPVHQWKIRASRRTSGQRNKRELWRIPRNTVVRSLDRLKDEYWSEEWLSELEKRLEQLQDLKTAVAEAEICCRDCISEDLFEGLLDRKLIFKFLSTLPEDKGDLADLLYEVVESKVPIWFWAYELPANLTDFAERVDRLLAQHENLRESAMLAQLILDQRSDFQELGLLFDCHLRIPQLPTLAVDASGQLRQPAA